MSTVSDTDVQIFLALSNPENTNSTPPQNLATLQSSIKEESEDEEGEDLERDSDSNSDSEKSKSCSSNSDNNASESDGDDVPPLVQSEVKKPRSRNGSEVSRHTVRSKANSGVSFRSKLKDKLNASQVNPTSQVGSPFSFSQSTNAVPSNQFQQFTEPALSREELLLEKQSVLLELERLKTAHNVTLTKNYTLDDRLDDMQFEVRRHLLNIEEANTLNFMRDGMKLAFTGIELANSKLGPFLELDGWSSEMCQDIQKYDSALSRLHKKYWRRNSMSPEMELGMAILGSIGMHHFKKKFMPSVLDPGFASQFMQGNARTKMNNMNRSSTRFSSKEEDDDDEQLPAAFL